MADKRTVDAYNKIADEFNDRNSLSIYREEYQLFRSFFGNERKILEIGCGTGRDARALIDIGFDYIGIDASEEMLRIAQKRVPSGKFIIGDFFHLPFRNDTFDGFWAVASFLHVPKTEIDTVLQQAHRVAKPHGIGFISLKEKTVMDEGYIKESKGGGIERYFSFYTPGEFQEILARNQFEISDSRTHTEHDGTKWLCYFVRVLK